MSFGLTGAPNSFQGAMNTTLHPLLRKCVLAFFDDILVYSSSYEDHIHHLAQVFELLSKDQWLVKLSKCSFAKQSISYLGHIVSAQGVSTDPSKIEAVKAWPTPSDVKQLRSFLGLTGYYRKFVKHYAVITRPLTDLLKKGVLFAWTANHTVAVLHLTRSNKPLLKPRFWLCRTSPSHFSCILTLVTAALEPYSFKMSTHWPLSVNPWDLALEGCQPTKKNIWLFSSPWSTGDLICSMVSS